MLAAFVRFALMGLWEQSIQTLALMLAAVILSLIIGMPIGDLGGPLARVHRAITPVLDAMQIVPAFAYLMPVVILFCVGPAAAVICTMIYAIPPAVRITALGIRGVTHDTVEAAQAFGATPLQTLFKVQLPLARKQLLLAVNQTIMFALSLVVIAGLIGGSGLGDVVTNGLYSNAALALLAGVAIVIMAIALDRATEAIAERTDPTRRHLTDDGRRRAAARHAGRARRDRRRSSLVCRALGVDAVYPDEFETASYVYTRDDRGHAAGLDPVRARLRAGPGLVHLRDHRADRELPRQVRARAAAGRSSPSCRGSSRSPGSARSRCVVSGLRPAITVALMLLAIGDHGRLGARDGHGLAGARGDGDRGRDRHRVGVVGGGEPARREGCCGRCSTRCRRCRSSSTSSRSST